jgi:hypothetical protein
MAVSKPRVIKDFEKLEDDIQKQIKFAYPSGFYQNLISYVDKDGNKRMALPFETDEKYYLVRMTIQEAKDIIDEDEDYDSDGLLKIDVQEEYADKFGDSEFGEEEEEDDSYDKADEPADEEGDDADED